MNGAWLDEGLIAVVASQKVIPIVLALMSCAPHVFSAARHFAAGLSDSLRHRRRLRGWLMARLRDVGVARVVGHVSWWVFVVARLMSEPGLTMGGAMPRRYADYSGGSFFGVGLGPVRPGWTTNEPLTDRSPAGLSDQFGNSNVIPIIAVIALAATIIAALAEAVIGQRWLVGAGTVLAPVIGAAIILTALYGRAGLPSGGDFDLPLLIVFVLVLLGVGVREVWSRVPHRTWPRRGDVNPAGHADTR
jgi:hypothetical protein